MASQNGTISTSSKASVITTTAGERRLPVKRCTFSISGQVAMTRVTAQMIAGRNGCITQKLAVIRPPMNSTTRVVRVRSWCGSDMVPRTGVTATG